MIRASHVDLSKPTPAEAEEIRDLQLGKDGSKWRHDYVPLNAAAVALKAHKAVGSSGGSSKPGKNDVKVGEKYWSESLGRMIVKQPTPAELEKRDGPVSDEAIKQGEAARSKTVFANKVKEVDKLTPLTDAEKESNYEKMHGTAALDAYRKKEKEKAAASLKEHAAKSTPAAMAATRAAQEKALGDAVYGMKSGDKFQSGGKTYTYAGRVTTNGAGYMIVRAWPTNPSGTHGQEKAVKIRAVGSGFKVL